MKILIKINKRLYKYAKHHTFTASEIDEICDVIANGKPLPEHHGDFKDVNDIWNNIPDVNVLTNHFTTYDIQHFIDDAPTIIEGSESE